jgi:hypothetical protein
MRRRNLVAIVAVVCVLNCAGTTYRAVRAFWQPFPAWMIDADQWYDDAAWAAWHALVAVACVVYRRRTGPPVRPGLTSARWQDRLELRAVLYASAALFALQLPIGVFKATRALSGNRPPWLNPWTAFPTWGLIGPPLAIALITYDRRRLRREFREDAGKCLRCGYDLRATPGRCPECGREVVAG